MRSVTSTRMTSSTPIAANMIINQSGQSIKLTDELATGITQSTSHLSPIKKNLTNFSIDSIIGGQAASEPQVIKTHQQGYGDAQLLLEHQQSSVGNLLFSSPLIRHPQHHHDRSTRAGQQHTRKLRPKNFLCPTCKMAFSNNGQLRNHARIHTGERPFRCQYENCNKTFTRNEELTRHKLIHSGFRPHACQTCGKRFGRKDHLKKHLKTHDNKRSRQLRKRTSFVLPSSPQRFAANHIRQPTSDHILDSFGTVDIIHRSDHKSMRARPPQTLVKPQDFLDPMLFNPTPASAFATPLAAPISLPPMINPPTSSSSSATSSLILQQAACLRAQMETLERQEPQSSPSIQLLASEYWNRWYSLMGLYQTDGQYSQATTVHQMMAPKPTRQ